MALVKIGFFCSGGHTELGARSSVYDPRPLAAVDAVVRKIDPRLEWVRLFPARTKPGPKLGRVSLRDDSDGGVTGSALTTTMFARLRTHHGDRSIREVAAIVLIDDADCRFATLEALAAWEAALERQVRELTSRPALLFIALLASPEVEAWLIADWNEGFGQQYAPIQPRLAAALARPEHLGPRPWTQIERFGHPYDAARAACSRKLSEELQQVLRTLLVTPSTYSKREQGPDMLRRIRPHVVADVCRLIFAPALRRILALLDRPEPTPTP